MNGRSRPVSKPEYDVRLDRQVRMPMGDGVELAAVVARPDAAGEFPAIVAYNPYRRLTGIEAGVSESGYDHRRHGPAWFARRGYAVVSFDARGTGNSGGSTTDIYSEHSFGLSGGVEEDQPARVRRLEAVGCKLQSPSPAPVTRSVQWYSVCPSISRAWEQSRSISSKQSWA